MRALFASALMGFGLISAFNDVSALNPRDSSGVGAGFSLADDEVYRRDGVLSTLRTCLAVADDFSVRSIWELDAFQDIKRLPEAKMAREMMRLDDDVKYRRGFGTIFACAQVVAAWHAKTVSASIGDPYADQGYNFEPKDGRFEHGSLVIDLSIDKNDRALIDPVPLTRILTSPGLLPKFSYGGVVLRNAIVNGPLLFHNLHLMNPLAFVNVKFAGRSYKKKLFNVDDPIERTALAINYSRFDDHILFSDVEICGHIRINDSHFRETVTFQDSKQMDMGCSVPRAKHFEAILIPANLLEIEKRPPPKVDINSSRFDQGLTSTRSTFGSLKLAGGRIDSFASSRTYFGDELRIVGANIDSLQIDCSVLAGHTAINYNHVDKDLFITGTAEDDACGNWWHESHLVGPGFRTHIEIASNRIGGGLGMKGFHRSRLGGPINLASNRVGNGSKVVLPAPDDDGRPWRGEINLGGSTFEGTIEIGIGNRSKDGSPGQLSPAPLEAYCPPTNETKPNGATFQFRAAQIRTLVWNLPLTCDYRWLGFGLDYDLWLPGTNAKTTSDSTQPDPDREPLQTWRLTLGRYQSAALGTMSRYLDDKGAYVPSRNILLEAKRLNYAPDCKPNSDTLTCAMRILGKIWSSDDQSRVVNKEETSPIQLAAVGGAAPDDPQLVDSLSLPWSWFTKAWSELSSIGMLFLLWPGGYGAQPERAIILLLATMGISFVFYRLYSFKLLTELKNASRQLDKFDIVDKPAWLSSGDWHLLSADERKNRIVELHDVVLLHVERKIEETNVGNSEKARVRKLRRLLDVERFGNTETLGFSLFDQDRMPTRFTHWLYSVDTTLPFIDLHAYGNYYPVAGKVRMASVLQHIIGWWLITVFIASAAIL